MNPISPLPHYKDRSISNGKHRQYDAFSYTKIQFIGEGAKKRCWKARFNDGVKAVLKEKFAEKDFKELAHYLKVIDTLKGHPAIAVTEQTFWTKGKNGGYKFFQIQTFYAFDLLTAVNNDLFLNNSVLVQVAFRQLADGLSYIHEKGATVKDIKLDNIYVNFSVEKFQLVFGDFGGTDLLNEPSAHKTASVLYASPQRLMNNLSVMKDDIYSLGLCFAAIQKIVYGFKFPVEISRSKRISLNLAIEKFTKDYITPTFKPLISEMIAFERDKRPSAEALKNKVRKIKTHKRVNSI